MAYHKVRATLTLDGADVEIPVTFFVYLDGGDASVGVGPGVDDWQVETRRKNITDALDSWLTDKDRDRLVAWLYQTAIDAASD